MTSTKVYELNKETIIKKFVNAEGNLRKFFLEARKVELKKNTTFKLLTLEAKLYGFSTNLKNQLKLDPEKDYVQLNLVADFEIDYKKDNKEKEIYSEYILNEFFTPYEVTQTSEKELEQLIEEVNKELTYFGQISYKHWREVKPTIRDLVITSPKKEYDLFFWFHEDRNMFVWANSFSDIENLVGTDEGYIRSIEIDFSSIPIDNPYATSDKVKNHRQATTSELTIIHRYGDFNDRHLLKVKLKKEKEYKEIRDRVHAIIPTFEY